MTTRISDPGIHRNIRKFHASVTAADPRLHEICQPTSRSHVTLDTLNIDDGAEQSVLDAVRRAVASTEQAWLPDGYSQIFRSYLFGPLGFWTMAPLRCEI